MKNSPKVANGCIYKIPCKDYNCVYFGQTGKGIATRVKKHKYSVRTGQMSNALFLHTINFNHAIDWNMSEVFLYCNIITRRNIIESAVMRYHANLINVSQGIYKLDDFMIINKIVRLVPA